MLDVVRVPALAALLGLSAMAPSGAAEPTFAELLDRATAQAEAGRQWGPPGDNVTDTFLAMSKMLSAATPQQLAAFEALLHKEQEALAREPEPAQGGQSVMPQAGASVMPQAGPAVAPQAGQSVAPQAGQSLAPQAGPAGTRQADEGAGRVQPAPHAQPPARVAAAPAVAPPTAAAELFARGRQAEALGDISAARRLYARAAQGGHADAARALSQLYDPGYLRRHTVGGIDADAGLARYWSERADDLSGGRTAAIPEQRLAR